MRRFRARTRNVFSLFMKFWGPPGPPPPLDPPLGFLVFLTLTLIWTHPPSAPHPPVWKSSIRPCGTMKKSPKVWGGNASLIENAIKGSFYIIPNYLRNYSKLFQEVHLIITPPFPTSFLVGRNSSVGRALD